MRRSTHSDRTAAWAAKQKDPGYRAKKIIPYADFINKIANNSSLIESKEVLNEIENNDKPAKIKL